MRITTLLNRTIGRPVLWVKGPRMEDLPEEEAPVLVIENQRRFHLSMAAFWAPASWSMLIPGRFRSAAYTGIRTSAFTFGTGRSRNRTPGPR